MLKNYFVFLILFCVSVLPGKAQVQFPEAFKQSVSWGDHQHTSRDEPYFTGITPSNNIITLGTTERDSTFIDLQLIKLNSQLETVWETRFSEDRGISYDSPVALLVGPSEEIYVVSRVSLTNNAWGPATLLKFSPEGELLWKRPLQDPENELDYRFYPNPLVLSLENGKIHLAADIEGVALYFFEIDAQTGAIDFFWSRPGTSWNSTISRVDAKFYTLHTTDIENGDQVHFSIATPHGSELEVNLSEDPLFNPDVFIGYADSNTGLYAMDNGNTMVVNNRSASYSQSIAGITVLDPSGTIIDTLHIKDPNRTVTLLANYRNDAGDIKFYTAYQVPLNDTVVVKNETLMPDLTLQATDSIVLVDPQGFKLNNDHSLTLIDPAQYQLFDESLNRVNTFPASEFLYPYDILKLEDDSMLEISILLERKYEDSDFIGERNIIHSIVEPSGITLQHEFTGEGTSHIRAGADYLKIREVDGGYVVMYHEYTGPTSIGTGLSTAPVKTKLAAYDHDLQKQWVSGVSDSWGKAMTTDQEGNIYIHTTDSLYKYSPAGETLFKVAATLPKAIGFTEGEADLIVLKDAITTDEYDRVFYDMEMVTYNKETGVKTYNQIYPRTDLVATGLGDASTAYTYLKNDNDNDVLVLRGKTVIDTVNLNVDRFGGSLDAKGKLFYTWETCYRCTKWLESYDPETGENSRQVINYDWALTQVSPEGNLVFKNDNRLMVVMDRNFNSLYSYSFPGIPDGYFFPTGTWFNGYFVGGDHYGFNVILDPMGDPVLEYEGLEYQYARNTSDGQLIVSDVFGAGVYTTFHYQWKRGYLAKYDLQAFLDLPDYDNDLVPNEEDNCPSFANGKQEDTDGDGLGDACDEDIDNDNIRNEEDNCLYAKNGDQLDNDKDGIGDACDEDDDNDGIPDSEDNCPLTPNPDQADGDQDGIGDTCDNDLDNDGIENTYDQCPGTLPGVTVDANGCEFKTLPPDNFGVVTRSVSCLDAGDGALNITAQTPLKYTAVLTKKSGTAVATSAFSDAVGFSDLEEGYYNVCITAEELPGFSQCYEVFIGAPHNFQVENKTIDYYNKSLTLKLSGGTMYYVEWNGTLYNNPEGVFVLPLERRNNSLKAFTDKNCQGEIEEVISLDKNTGIYPNPVQDGVFYLGSPSPGASGKEIRVAVYSLSGTLLFNKQFNLGADQAVNIAGFPAGIYIVEQEFETTRYRYKLIVN